MENEQFIERVALLENKVKELERGLARMVKVSREYNLLLKTYCDNNRDKTQKNSVDIRFAVERLEAIEVKLFPHLLEDVMRIDALLGKGDDKANNPLDRRKS